MRFTVFAGALLGLEAAAMQLGVPTVGQLHEKVC